MESKRKRYLFFADDDYDDDDFNAWRRSVSARHTQVNWFEPAQLRCQPGSVLRVVGLKPLDRHRSHHPDVSKNCSVLQTLLSQLKSTCEAKQNCVFDFGTVKTIRSSCPHVKYISIAVYCQSGNLIIQHSLHCI